MGANGLVLAIYLGLSYLTWNSSVTCNVCKLSPVNEYVISGILASSSSTKILLKKLFSDSAFSLFETENVPLGLFNVGILALVFSFEWTYFQNCLGLCLLSAASFFSKVLSCLVNVRTSFLAFVNVE